MSTNRNRIEVASNSEQTNESIDNQSLSTNGNSPDPHQCDPSDDHPNSLCPLYDELRHEPRWRELRQEHNYPDVKCGHVIKMLCDDVGSKIKIRSGKRYAFSLKRFIEFIHQEGLVITQVDLQDIDAYMKTLSREGLSKESASASKSAIIRIVKYTDLYMKLDVNVRYGLIREEIQVADYLFRKPLKKGFLSKQEVKALPKHAGSPLGKNLILVEMVTGQRVSDLVEIKTNQLDLDNAIIELENTKTEGEYTLPLTRRVVLSLRRWINVERCSIPGAEDNEYLFPSRKGGHISSRRFSGILDEAARNAGVQEIIDETELTERQRECYGTEKDTRQFKRVTPHTLRRTLSNLLLDSTDVSKSALALDDTEEVVRKHYRKQEDPSEVLRDPLRDLFDKE